MAVITALLAAMIVVVLLLALLVWLEEWRARKPWRDIERQARRLMRQRKQH